MECRRRKCLNAICSQTKTNRNACLISEVVKEGFKCPKCCEELEVPFQVRTMQRNLANSLVMLSQGELNEQCSRVWQPRSTAPTPAFVITIQLDGIDIDGLSESIPRVLSAVYSSPPNLHDAYPFGYAHITIHDGSGPADDLGSLNQWLRTYEWDRSAQIIIIIITTTSENGYQLSLNGTGANPGLAGGLKEVNPVAFSRLDCPLTTFCFFASKMVRAHLSQKVLDEILRHRTSLVVATPNPGVEHFQVYIDLVQKQ